MNFKIENNFLDITNYPTIENHFEEMASKGWLIKNIIAGNIFFYKKIKPEALDFSISPYEVETEFTRKTKSELAEFQSVCESVGWNYATKSFNLHIYYKEKGSEALDIQTEEEEEFRVLETIGKRYIRGLYIQIPMFILLTWFILGGLFTGLNAFKDALPQLLGFLMPITLFMMVLQLIQVKRFLKLNRENMELGESIEYSKSNFHYNRFVFSATFIFMFIFILYILYSIIVLNNKFLLIGLAPALIGTIIGLIYRFVVKPSKIPSGSKKIGLVVTLVLAFIIPVIIFGFFITNISNGFENIVKPNIDGYKVLSVNDFVDNTVVENGNLRRQASFLVPKSYEYYSHSNQIYESTNTEYSKALTENLAESLVNRYIRQAEIAVGRYKEEIKFYFKEGLYDEFILGERAGISLEEFNSLKEQDRKAAVNTTIKKIKERSIIKNLENLWNADEAYFLNYNRTEIVIRNGKEVFYLEGKDFSDPVIVKAVKEKLVLN